MVIQLKNCAFSKKEKSTHLPVGVVSKKNIGALKIERRTLPCRWKEDLTPKEAEIGGAKWWTENFRIEEARSISPDDETTLTQSIRSDKGRGSRQYSRNCITDNIKCSVPAENRLMQERGGIDGIAPIWWRCKSLTLTDFRNWSLPSRQRPKQKLQCLSPWKGCKWRKHKRTGGNPLLL